MILGLQSGGGEGAIEPLLEQLGDVLAEMPDENELAVAELSCDAGEHLVVLRQIFEQRLRAPIGRRSRTKPQFLRVTAAGSNSSGS